MNRTVHARSGHTLHVSTISKSEISAEVHYKNADTLLDFDTFYEVRNWDKDGVVFMYLAKGHVGGPTQICAFYRGGGFWGGFGVTLKTAIDGAQLDGWMYA